MKTIRLIAGVAVITMLAYCNPASNKGPATPKWAIKLKKKLYHVTKSFDGQIGIYVKDLNTGYVFNHNASNPWYLASVIKMFIGTEVYKQIDAGKLRLRDTVYFTKSDKRDGAGPTSYQRVGSRLSVEWLLEQMLWVSDNAASDLLIKKIGINNINKTIHSEVPNGIGTITSLLDVRKLAYGEMHPRAKSLSNKAFMALKKTPVRHRPRKLSQLLRIPTSRFRVRDYTAAYEKYYKHGYNTASLVAIGNYLEKIATGDLVNKRVSKNLFEMMSLCKTGGNRLKGGFPRRVGWAQKTGTQHRRACNVGILSYPNKKSKNGKKLVIAACTKKFQRLKDADATLRKIGKAISISGVLKTDTRYSKNN